MLVWLSCNTSVSINIVTLRQVQLVRGKPPRCRTSYPGLLSLSHLVVGRRNWVSSKRE